MGNSGELGQGLIIFACALHSLVMFWEKAHASSSQLPSHRAAPSAGTDLPCAPLVSRVVAV